jgi:exodeoxyribonuclease VII large subunit
MKRDPFGLPEPEPGVQHAFVRRHTGQPGIRSPVDEAYSVTAVNALAKRLLETNLPPLWVRGEVTGWKQHTSGHCYFTLRDRTSQLRCVMFRLEAQALPAHPDEGMEVRALGTLTLYERKGDFQFIVRDLEGGGAGGLWRVAFERCRRKLEAEGLLAAERKRPLPRHPRTVAVVTSPVGAALQDILQVVARRAPWTKLLFAPAKVQGEGAARDLVRAIRAVGRSGLADVLIVGRGGGSMEDLWAFNDELLARAIAASPIPVVSAVGHEADITIADLVADVRAPTPSAAAERVVPDGSAVQRELKVVEERLRSALNRSIVVRRSRTEAARDTMRRTGDRMIVLRRARLEQLARHLDALSPLAALRRGFAVPLDETGRVLRAVSDFAAGERVRLRVSDGTVALRTEGVDVVDADTRAGGRDDG